jgi:hypothetical protein
MDNGKTEGRTEAECGKALTANPTSANGKMAKLKDSVFTS